MTTDADRAALSTLVAETEATMLTAENALFDAEGTDGEAAAAAAYTAAYAEYGLALVIRGEVIKRDRGAL